MYIEGDVVQRPEVDNGRTEKCLVLPKWSVAVRPEEGGQKSEKGLLYHCEVVRESKPPWLRARGV